MKFFPGQRIKKVRGTEGIGVEASVIQYQPEDEDGRDLEIVMLTPAVIRAICENPEPGRPDIIVPFAALPGSRVMTPSGMWEPAIPPGQKSIEEEGKLWLTSQGEIAP